MHLKQAVNIVMRHIREEEGSRPKTFEQLVELTRTSPRREVSMANGGLKFTQLGEFSLDAYKDNYVAMSDQVRAKVVRPNGECTNGYVHVVDTVMLDDSPVWAVAAPNHAAQLTAVRFMPACLSLAAATTLWWKVCSTS